jgi:hypothetical protein
MTAWSHDKPVPPRRSPEQIADYREWAQFTRALMGWTDITAEGDTRLRQLARQQADEARSQPPPGRRPHPGPPAALPDGVRIPVPRQAPCPGEFGPGGKFREHCTPPQEAT